MTSKELAYVEDALEHEKFFKTQCQETMAKMQNQELKDCICQISQKHQQIYKNLYNVL